MSTLLPYLLLLYALLLGSSMLLTWALYRRGSTARRELSQRLHDQSLAASRRADHLQAQLDRLRRRAAIDQLHGLIAEAEEAAEADPLPREAARELRRYVLSLQREEERRSAGELEREEDPP